MSHYKWVEENINAVAEKLGCHTRENRGMVHAHGDKCYSFQSFWKTLGIPFHEGVLLYCLSRDRNYADEVRQTSKGFVPVDHWVATMWQKHRDAFEECSPYYEPEY